jgi:energy-converting hydrogenase B subunit D
MTVLQVAALVLVGAGALAVVLARDPLRQVIVNGAYGLLLTALFVVFQAPDVALSMLVVGTVALPVVILSAVVRIRDEERGRPRRRK